MILNARPQVGKKGFIQIWVGIFYVDNSERAEGPTLAFKLNEQPTVPENGELHPIRDSKTRGDHQPLNYQGVFQFKQLATPDPVRLHITANNKDIELIVPPFPTKVPAKLEGTFNLLLSSCYFQPEDKGLLGYIVKGLRIKPDMTVLAGDQVYLDLPLFEDLPEDAEGLAQAFGTKYERNWISDELNIPGLQKVLKMAPTVCIPDDHELFNNAPVGQAQLPGTHLPAARARWIKAATGLYEDYQQGGPPGSAGTSYRVDIEPMYMLFLDTRMARSSDFDSPTGLMSASTVKQLEEWEQALTSAKANHQSCVGVLSGGQALFVDTPNALDERVADAEYSNFKQFRIIQDTLNRLATLRIPVVYLTGDVHWSRVAQATHRASGLKLLTEVICSPSCLMRTPWVDRSKELINSVKNWLGPDDAWPRHSPPEPAHGWFGANSEFSPVPGPPLNKGDYVAMLQFCTTGQVVEMTITFFSINAQRRATQVGPFALLSY